MAIWNDLNERGKPANFLDRLLDDPAIRQYLSPEEIRQCFEVNKNFRHVDAIYRRLGLQAA
jgi:hypothetical protein